MVTAQPPAETQHTDTTDRACIECDAVYRGPLKCPKCDRGVGEPLDNQPAQAVPGGLVVIRCDQGASF